MLAWAPSAVSSLYKARTDGGTSLVALTVVTGAIEEALLLDRCATPHVLGNLLGSFGRGYVTDIPRREQDRQIYGPKLPRAETS